MGAFNLNAGGSGGGDGAGFLPILKYNSQSGKLFRMDRVDTGGGWVSEEVDITNSFKALADFENLEHGWISFAGGRAPDFKLVPFREPLPPKPEGRDDKGKPLYAFGVRFLAKLSAICADNQPPVREIAGTALAFLQGVEEVFEAYVADPGSKEGLLPILELTKTVGVKSGQPPNVRTNYQPVFRIAGWAARGDFVHTPKGGAVAAGEPGRGGSSFTNRPPATGSSRVAAPMKAEAMSDDFG